MWQEDVSSSYLQKTVSIAESQEEVTLSEEEARPSRDKVLTSYSNNGSSGNGSMGSTDEDSHLPSFETHRQRKDTDSSRSKKPAFQSVDLQGDSDSID